MKKFLSILVLLTLLFHGTCFAQTGDNVNDPTVDPLRQALADCRLVANVMERLACYDDTIRHFNVTEQTLMSVNLPNSTGLWTLKTEISNIDDTKTMYLNLESDDLITLSTGRKIRPLLIVRCNPNHVSTYVVWDTFLGDRDRPIVSRLDRERSISLEWHVSNDRTATFHPDPLPFIKDLLAHKNLSLQIMPPHESTFTVDFSLSGFNNAVKAVKSDCGW